VAIIHAQHAVEIDGRQKHRQAVGLDENPYRGWGCGDDDAPYEL
jgi:hypothetical protein